MIFSSSAVALKEENQALAAIIESLGDDDLECLEPVSGGGNNRVFRADFSSKGSFAAKFYPAQSEDTRDRLGAEFGALKFLQENGVGGMVPQPIAMSQSENVALYEWIEGSPMAAEDPQSRTSAGIEAMTALLKKLSALRHLPDASNLPKASECCLSGAEVVRQIKKRRARFADLAENYPALEEFLESRFDPLLDDLEKKARLEYSAAGHDFETEIPESSRFLSPSDFGFHNARRRSDGSLVFLDFEYFGWDDPVKLTSDVLWHPGHVLSREEKDSFFRAMTSLCESDKNFSSRLAAVYPLIGLRWCLILLNEYLPERWYRRAMADSKLDRDKAKARQLKKAVHFLKTVERENSL
jgi:hypothetical protein